MKIEIADHVVSEILGDMMDEVVKAKMRFIIADDRDYPHPGDVEYYQQLVAAAETIYKHYSVPGADDE